MKRTLLSLLAICAAIGGSFAQSQHRSCGNDLLRQRIIARDPSAAARFEAQKAGYQQIIDAAALSTNTAAKTTNLYDTIPVIFHIVLTAAQQTQLGGAAGIAGRAQTNLDVINQDFAGLNADSTAIPDPFKPYFAKGNIRFGFAHTTPTGGITQGYEVVTTTKTAFDSDGQPYNTTGSKDGFSDANYASAGGADGWDESKYLNIWVINMQSSGIASGILGLTKPPSYIGNVNFGYYPQAEEGIYINYLAFGKRTSPGQNYLNGIDGGRTLTHELGHYFEIWHVWGDDNGKCPGQSGYADDGITDTPPQGAENYYCPTFPSVSCTASSPNGDMFMDYMDYVDDACMHMFTTGQVAVMNSKVAAGGESNILTTHPQLLQYPLAVSNVGSALAAVNIAPNPTSGLVTVTLPANSRLQQYSITNAMGQQLKAPENTTGNLLRLDLSGFAKGIYFLHCRFDNGSATQKIVLQ